MACDLHIHSTVSDGGFTPVEVVDYANRIGLSCISLTDHDSVLGIEDATRRADELGAPFIPGIEMTTAVEEREIHVLGYFIDINDPSLQNALDLCRKRTFDRLNRIVSRLTDQGFPITMEEVVGISGEGSMGRPHIALAMVRRGYVENAQEAFERFIGSDGDAYVSPNAPHSKDACRLIIDAGGIPAIAHPGQGGRADMMRDIDIETHKEWGAMAIEAFHPRHDDYMINYYIKLSQKLEMGVVGGSDCHGPYYPKILMDKKFVPDWVAEKFRNFYDSLSFKGGRF